MTTITATIINFTLIDLIMTPSTQMHTQSERANQDSVHFVNETPNHKQTANVANKVETKIKITNLNAVVYFQR